ncbi:MAG: hypothetical protein KDD35_04110, partial [Bdellovibrionales bacterium]|nr:hypothetical protein [Bdellovibrionales bacterium]
MSLEELLKEPKSSSAWKTQRKLLLRIIFGVSTISIALLAGVFFVTRLKKTNVSEPPPQARHEAREVSLLTELMKLRNEASQLQEEIQDLRNKTSTPGAGGTGGGVPSHQQAPNQNSVRRSYEAGSDRGSIKVFDIDPGDGFTKVNVETKEYYIPTGAIFQARLITPIKTSVSKTFVMAETTREYRMDMNRKIPKGSRLIGRASLNTVLKGVGVE